MCPEERGNFPEDQVMLQKKLDALRLQLGLEMALFAPHPGSDWTTGVPIVRKLCKGVFY